MKHRKRTPEERARMAEAQRGRWAHEVRARPSAFRDAREALGLSQVELGARLGLDVRTVRRLEGRPALAPYWARALEGLAVELWAEHLCKIGALTLAYAEKRAQERAERRARRRPRIALRKTLEIGAKP